MEKPYQNLRVSDHALSQPELTQWLRELRAHAYTDESHFAVSAILRSEVGGKHYYFAGVNVENVDHPQGVHAEGAAISAMVTTLGKYARFNEGWVMGGPASVMSDDRTIASKRNISCCGGCRQKLAGFASEGAIINSVPINGENITASPMATLLPDAFTFEMVDEKIAEEAKSRQATPAGDATELGSKMIRKGPLTNPQIVQWLHELESADFASSVSHAAVIQLDNGYYVAGVKVEDAAYSGLNAMQSAIANATTAFGKQTVKAVYSYGQGRDGKELPEKHSVSWSHAALQFLAEFCDPEEMPSLYSISSAGTYAMSKFGRATSVAPTIGNPYSSTSGLYLS